METPVSAPGYNPHDLTYRLIGEGLFFSGLPSNSRCLTNTDCLDVVKERGVEDGAILLQVDSIQTTTYLQPWEMYKFGAVLQVHE
jgi:hypothetical protein